MASISRRRGKSSVRRHEKPSLGKVADPEETYSEALALARRNRSGDRQKVISLLRSASAAGSLEARHALAIWHIRGIGVRKNFALAVSLEREPARAGNVEAIFNLAYAYETGKGVPKDLRRAVGFYRRAARLGYRPAMEELSRCLHFGIGIRPNERLALDWSSRAESQEPVPRGSNGRSRRRTRSRRAPRSLPSAAGRSRKPVTSGRSRASPAR
jgi:TPR repeat protein